MADGTHISWTDATWNPITGCMIKSPGCQHCYAAILAATRLRDHPSRKGLAKIINGNAVFTGDVRFNHQWLDQPLRWRKPRDVFVVAHGDLFYEKVPDAWIVPVFEVMQNATQHRFQVLTKRPDRALRFLRDNGIWEFDALPHVIIGASVERQPEADERRAALEGIAKLGWRTWVSYEPALGPVDWSGWEFVKWMVAGGESDNSGQHRARPSHPNWYRATRNWCESHGIPFHFKQRGEWSWDNYPADDGPEIPMDWRERPDRFVCMRDDGTRTDGLDGSSATFIATIGKVAAGRMLDGRTWDDMPDAVHSPAA